MATQIIGWFLIVMGMFFILLAFLRAVLETLPDLLSAPSTGVSPQAELSTAGLKDLMELFLKVMEALVKLPQWFLFALVGIALIVAGQRVLAGLSILPFVS